MKKLFSKYLPKYINFWSECWLAVWSAPTIPCSTIDYFRALRITLRKGPYHSIVVLVLKRGTI